MVGVGRGDRPDLVRAALAGSRPASIDRYPQRLWNADPAGHRDGDGLHQHRSRGGALGGRRGASRRDRGGREQALAASRMSVLTVYTVFVDADEAARIADAVVSEGLA